MNIIKIRLDTPIELGYWDDIIELEIHYIPAGIVNILVGGKVPDLDIIEVIKENYAEIVDKVIAEQTQIAWETQEKAWDMDNIQDQT